MDVAFITNRLRDHFEAHSRGVVCVYLFGSVARDTARGESDVDVPGRGAIGRTSVHSEGRIKLVPRVFTHAAKDANAPSVAQGVGQSQVVARPSGLLPNTRGGHWEAFVLGRQSPSSESPAPLPGSGRRDWLNEAGAPNSPGVQLVAARRGAAPMPPESVLCRHTQAAEAFRDGWQHVVSGLRPNAAQIRDDSVCPVDGPLLARSFERSNQCLGTLLQAIRWQCAGGVGQLRSREGIARVKCGKGQGRVRSVMFAERCIVSRGIEEGGFERLHQGA